MSPDDNSMMNSILRRAGGAAMPADSKSSGSRDFTVQAPGTNAPDNQFVYEPLDTTPGAWAVYPPGIPCDANKTRISRTDPADVADFPKMQAAIDEESGGADATDTTAQETGEGETAGIGAGASSYGG
jgi:hypothetical protein